MQKMCEVASFKNFENSLTTVKVMTKNKVAPFYLGHGVLPGKLLGKIAAVLPPIKFAQRTVHKRQRIISTD